MLKEVQKPAGLPQPNWALSCLDQVTVKQKRKKLKPRSEEKKSGRSLHLKETGISKITEEDWGGQGMQTLMSKIRQELHFHL